MDVAEQTVSERDELFSAEEAVAVQREMRRVLGLSRERFPLAAFVGMISDEIEQFQTAGMSDTDVAILIKDTIGRDIAPDEVARFYSPPDVRRAARQNR
jgi:hypothetical protein